MDGRNPPKKPIPDTDSPWYFPCFEQNSRKKDTSGVRYLRFAFEARQGFLTHGERSMAVMPSRKASLARIGSDRADGRTAPQLPKGPVYKKVITFWDLYKK